MIVNDSFSFVDKISDRSFMGYKEYVESSLLSENSEEGYCYKCKDKLEPLTYVNKEFFYQPCWKCCSDKKRDVKAQFDRISNAIKEYYYDVLLGDRYLQLFIVDNIYFQNTLPHDYSTFKKIINSLDPPSRNDIWFLDWLPGYPKIISLDNIQGLHLVNLSSLYDIKNEEDFIKVGDYEITMPEYMGVDNKHYSRYNILNNLGERRCKRFKISKDKCLKFYNTDDNLVKSIFKLTRNGNEVAIGDLTHRDYVVIKLAIMRNKKFLKAIFELIVELINNIGTLRDSVFLKNSVVLDPTNELNLNLIWNPLSTYKDKDSVNISIF